MSSWHYAQINENNICVGESWLAGEVKADDMIQIADDIHPLGMKYEDGEWVEVEDPASDILDDATEMQLEQAMNIQYLVDLAEINEEVA